MCSFLYCRIKENDSTKLQNEYQRLVAGLRAHAERTDLVTNPILPEDIINGK